jgi:hypothetical protein
MGYMEKSIYGVMQDRLYYSLIWLKVGIAYHIMSLMSNFNTTRFQFTWFYSQHAWRVLRLWMEVAT